MKEQLISEGKLCNYDLHCSNVNLLNSCILHTQVITVHISEPVPSTKPKVLLSHLTT